MNSPVSCTKLRVGQINLQGGKTPTTELRVLAETLNLDIVMVQEPYLIRSGTSKLWKIPGMGLNTRIVPNNCQEKFKSAIIIFNNDVDVIQIANHTNMHWATAEITTVNASFIIVSGYLPPSAKIDPFIVDLEDMYRTLGKRKLIMGMDANSKNDLWYSDHTDERGESLEEVIFNSDMYILNEPDNPPTFNGPCGTSNIDLTISNSKFVKFLSGWKVHANKISSDHQLITFEVGKQIIREQGRKRFIFRKANWEKCQQELTKQLWHVENIPWTPTADCVEKRAEGITKAIQHTMSKCIPVARSKPSKNPWWNDELNELKRSVEIKRKIFQRSKYCDRETNRRIYKDEMKKYMAEIRAAKKTSWTKFVKEDLGKNSKHL
jgi:hypothetical protein